MIAHTLSEMRNYIEKPQYII